MCYGALITGAVQTFSLSDPRRKTELKVNHSEHYLSVTHAPFSQQIHLPLISAELGESAPTKTPFTYTSNFKVNSAHSD